MASEEKPGGIEDKEGGEARTRQNDDISVGRVEVGSLPVGQIKEPASEPNDGKAECQASTGGKSGDAHKWPWAAIWIFMTACGTVGLGIFAYLAWCQSLEATRIARTQLVYSQRAFINIQLRLNADPTTRELAIGADVVITNAGNTPTRSLVMRVGCSLRAANDARSPFFERWDQQDVRLIHLGPKQTDVMQACVLKDPEIDQIRNPKFQKFVFAEARYLDVLDENQPHRITRMVRQVFFNAVGYGSSTRPFGSNNCADYDCPQKPKNNGSQPP